jgi:hypothetical protein
MLCIFVYVAIGILVIVYADLTLGVPPPDFITALVAISIWPILFVRLLLAEWPNVPEDDEEPLE